MHRDEGAVLGDARAPLRVMLLRMAVLPVALLLFTGCVGGTDKEDAEASPEIKRLGYGCSSNGREDDADFGLFEFRMSTVGMAEDTGSALMVIHFVDELGEGNKPVEMKREWESPESDWARWGLEYESSAYLSCCDQDSAREDWPVHFELRSDEGALLDCAYSEYAEDFLPSDVLSACRRVEFFDFYEVDGAFVGWSTWWDSICE